VVADNLDRWYAAHLIELVALALMIPAILGLAHLIHQRRPTLSYAGGGLSLIGVVSVAAVTGADGMAGYFVAKASPDSPTSIAFFDNLIDGGRMLPLYLATLLLGIGLVVTAVGLYRSRVVPAWAALAIGTGAILLDIGFPAGVPALILLGIGLLLVGMGSTGYSVPTETDSAWSRRLNSAASAPGGLDAVDEAGPYAGSSASAALEFPSACSSSRRSGSGRSVAATSPS
jgi:hypothetical protein